MVNSCIASFLQIYLQYLQIIAIVVKSEEIITQNGRENIIYL